MQIKSFFIFSAILLTGCVAPAVNVEGTSLDSYVQTHGVPQSSYDLQNGNKLHFFKTLCSNNNDYKEYNVEVTPANIIVRENVTRNCSYSSYQNSAYPVFTYQDYLKQKYDKLNDEYDRIAKKQVQVSEAWLRSEKEKGVIHPDTVALKQQYDDLVDKANDLKDEMESIKREIE